MKPIKLSVEKWELLKVRLIKDYSPSVMLIRSRMRDVLGFTPRNHEDWAGYFDHSSKADRTSGNYGYKYCVHLDFFDDAKRTLFVLKYSEYFDGRNQSSDII